MESWFFVAIRNGGTATGDSERQSPVVSYGKPIKFEPRGARGAGRDATSPRRELLPTLSHDKQVAIVGKQRFSDDAL